MNIFAFSLPILILVFWMIVGYSTLSLLHTQRNTLQNMLMAPAIGIAVTLLPIFCLSRLGLPVEKFAISSTITLLVLSILLLYKQKPLFAFRYYLPFAGILLLALFLTGRPLLQFGFNWLSYGNDDMANYCLKALRLLHHGYFDFPSVNDLSTGRDHSLFYWYMDVPGMTRAGSDLLLAWVSAITHLNPSQVFMPLIMAFLLALISVTGAIIYRSREDHIIAMTACFLLACSPLNSLGALYQLIAQVGGIALFIGVCLLLLQPFNLNKKHIVLSQSILISIMLSALMIVYPETAPFLVLSLILYFAVSAFQGWRPTAIFWKTAGLSLVFSLLILNKYCDNLIVFINRQIYMGFAKFYAELFPYFLVPSGIADLWGLQIISIMPNEPWQSISIILGIALLAFAVITALIQIRSKLNIAVVLLVMLSLGLPLFRQQNGFALFKLAMYMQPFLLAILVIGLFKITHKRYIKLVLIGAFSMATLYSQLHYVKYSYGEPGAPGVELANASQTGFLNEIKQIELTYDATKPLIIDSHNIVAAKILSLYFLGKQKTFYSRDFFIAYSDYCLPNIANGKYIPASVDYFCTRGKQIYSAIKANSLNSLQFSLNDPTNPLHVNKFTQLTADLKNSNLLISTPMRTIFNRRKFPDETKENFRILPFEKATNYLVFIHSRLGQDYYLSEDQHISLRNLQKDYFFADQTFVGIGRYLLLQTINPTRNARVELSITETLNADNDNSLPPAKILGKNQIPFPIVGRGSARVFSSPITPQKIAGNSYIMIDMGREGKRFPVNHTGLMNLYGTDISLDHRLLIGFVRDVSLVSEDEYQGLKAPHNVSRFPLDLENPELEYSGIYEDGWISEHAFFNLAQPTSHSTLKIKGFLPQFSEAIPSCKLTVKIDGKVLTEKNISGNFDFDVTVPYKKSNRKVELHFSKSQTLPGGDNRPAAAKIEFIGYKDTL